jgi:hypothetical protein
MQISVDYRSRGKGVSNTICTWQEAIRVTLDGNQTSFSMASDWSGGALGSGGGGGGGPGGAGNAEPTPEQKRARELKEEEESEEKIQKYPMSARSIKAKERWQKRVRDDEQVLFNHTRRQGSGGICGHCHLDRVDPDGLISAKKVTIRLPSSCMLANTTPSSPISHATYLHSSLHRHSPSLPSLHTRSMSCISSSLTSAAGVIRPSRVSTSRR